MKFTILRSEQQPSLAPGGSAAVEVALPGVEVLPDGAIFTSVVEAGDGSGGSLSACVIHAMAGARVVAAKVANIGSTASDRYVVNVLIAGIGSGAIA